jgi:hypothetical protein
MARRAPEPTPTRPDGIAPEHAEPDGFWRRHASPVSLVVLATVVGSGALGLLGSPSVEHRAEGPAATLLVASPDTIRNGEIFEARIDVEARRPIGKLVLGVSPSLWRDTTVNSMVPAPSEETHADGLFRFAFAPLAAGQRFEVKVALQINPSLSGRNEGRVVVLDGETPLVEMRRATRILP